MAVSTVGSQGHREGLPSSEYHPNHVMGPKISQLHFVTLVLPLKEW